MPSSNGNAELAVRDALTRSVGLALDSVLFDATAGDAIRPPGLRHGVAGVTPSTGSDFPLSAKSSSASARLALAAVSAVKRQARV